MKRRVEVLVPVVDMGAGTGFVVVEDARLGTRVRVPTDCVRLLNRRVYVAAVTHGVEDGFHRVTLPGGIAAWVEAVALPSSERGTAA